MLGAVLLALILGPLSPALPASAAEDEPLDRLLVQVLPSPVPAPDFSLDGTHAGSLRLRDLRGRVVLLNFWATWCVPCRAEMPALERLHREYGGRGLTVVGVNLKESLAAVQGFMKELQLTFAAVLDSNGAVSDAFKVRGLPMTFLLDREGRILWRALGPREWNGADGRAYFERLLQDRRP